MMVEVCILAKPSFSAAALSNDQSVSSRAELRDKKGSNEDSVVIEEVFENERYDSAKALWGHQLLVDGERRRYNSHREDGGADSLSFPQIPLPPGWEWMGSWKVEVVSPSVTDEEGWRYGAIWPDVNFPFEPKAIDPLSIQVRRRRWTRSRREVIERERERESLLSTTERSPLQIPLDPLFLDLIHFFLHTQTSEGKAVRIKADLLSVLDPRSMDRLLLGKLGPGGRLPLPLSWSNQEAGFELQFRPCDDEEDDEEVGSGGIDALLKTEGGYDWSQSSSSGGDGGSEGALILTSLEEGGTRLFTCTPRSSQPSQPYSQPSQPSASPLGFGSLVNQSLSILVPPSSNPISPQVWISVGMECEHLSCMSQSASQGEETRRDWKVTLRPPLVVKNLLPVDAR